MHKVILLLLIFIPILGCDKPNSEPERLDPIYAELQKELQETEAEIKTTDGELEGFKKDLKAVVPQTGQHKYAEKRVYESEAKLAKLRQMASYWKIRIESRKKWAQAEYLKAFRKKEPWPNPQEYQEYISQKKLEQAPKNWDAKKRLEESKLGFPGNMTKSEHAEATKQEGTPSEHH